MDKNERKSMIKVRGGFSERIGKPTCAVTIQLDEFDDRTRTFISNLLFDFLQITFQNAEQFRKQPYGNIPTPLSSDFCKDLGQDVFSFRNHLQGGYVYNWVDFYTSNIENALDNAPYNEILDLLEYICNWLFAKTNSCSEHFQRNFNTLFQQEYVGYRFISKRIVPITDEIEMQEIEKACQTPFEGARAQLQKALGFLSDREHPDYKNCVKESISAVESVCETIVGSDDGATLGKAVKHLEEHGLKIHSSLREGISKLYGYACDQGGVRHGEGEVESTVTFEEAKLMMVTCSAIVKRTASSLNCFEYCVPFAIMFFLHILILYHLLEEVIFTLYYLYTTTT